VNRDDLATFLRTRRHRLRPADVGLPGAGPRRTPGLRRQEVAQLAGMSVDYYIRLEQARGPRPSRLPATTGPWSDPDAARFARSIVADLRAAYARYPADPGIAALVTELLGVSPAFAEMWSAHDVESRRPLIKRVDHPLAGPLEFECQILRIPDTGQRLIVYCAAPGSATQAAFRRLAELTSAGLPASPG
jgi:MmyB-like transcription regulator ligand binding domain/Helix-turn-helix domain